ncbi:MAG: AGE family epimerase/isomerase, partial [Planctomycetota bacterium]
PSVDPIHGGFLEELSSGGEFTGREKFLTLQARQVWFFSRVAREGIRPHDSLEAAKSGFDFLVNHFHDSEHGGYFAKVEVNGQPVDRRKHVYPNAFVIYAFVEYYRATRDESALGEAGKLFQVLEEHCYDTKYGGYREFFYDDWRLITDPSEAGYVGAINTKTYNSHLHLLEAFAQLFRETQDPLVGERLAELIDINTLTVSSPNGPFNIDGWNRDWTPVETERNMRASYGHDVECAWLVIDAAEALGRSPATLRNWAESIVAYSLEFGYDERHGGFCYTGPGGKMSDDRKKVWWTQNEAMVAMLLLHQMTGRKRYREAFDGTMQFVFDHQIETDGGWWNTLKEDGSASDNPSRTSMWQGGYHNGRSLIFCEKMLRDNSKSDRDN